MNNYKYTGRLLYPLKIFVRYRSSPVSKLLFQNLRLKVVSFIAQAITHKVFVYGTLKKNEPNNNWLTDTSKGVSRFLSNGKTKKKYPLVIATKYNIPFLLYSPGVGYHVRGEIYEVDDKMLSQLDILEDHPNYCVRELDDIIIRGRDTEAESREKLEICWIYFLKKFKPELLKRQLFETYSSVGPHGLRYMNRSKRDPLYNYKKDSMGEPDSMH